MKLPRVRWPQWRGRRFPGFRFGRPRSRRGAALVALGLLVLLWCFCRGGSRPSWPHEQILAALRFVESSNRDDPPDGDDGKAIGPYQIHRVYWLDAQRADPTLGGTYEQCRQRAYAERVIAAYMRHYVPDAWQSGDAETIARVHNGGPKGPQNPKTDRYWRRVRLCLP